MGEKMIEELLKGIDCFVYNKHLDLYIDHICNDTRKVKKNDMFVCIKGSDIDSHFLLDDVYNSGCRCVVISEEIKMREDVMYIYVEDSLYVWALLCGNYFSHSHIKLIGVTGTKGKTTVCHCLYNMMNKKYKTGMITSQGIDYGCHIETINTTPDAYIIHKYLHDMENKGYEYCILEVSSLAVYHNRIEGLCFDIGVLTNISEDHIGGYEHPDFNHYVNCKREFLKKCSKVVVNGEKGCDEVVRGLKCDKVVFGVECDLAFKNLEYKNNKMCFDIEGLFYDHIEINKIGIYHIYNILPVLIICFELDIQYDKKINIDIKGRNEYIESNGIRVFIDYAHNAYAYSCLLESMKYYHYHQLIVVYGAGGNRDRSRRYDIGKIVASYHAYSVVTMDNPRYEDVNIICDDIVRGIKEYNGEYIVIIDRKQAIEYALDKAKEDDIVLCLGKGNEHYQIIKNQKIDFNEREIILNYLNVQ